jgi:hypothetical protein
MCPQNKYLKPDPKTNFTTCIKMSDDEIKNLCKELKKVFNNGQCIKGLTEEECKEKYDEDEPLFYKKVNKEKTKCVDLTIEKKMKMCLKYGKKFNGKKCSCPENTILLNGQCLGEKTLEQCFEEIKFSKPNLATGNSSCTLMTIKERENYCNKKHTKYINGDI